MFKLVASYRQETERLNNECSDREVNVETERLNNECRDREVK